MRRAIATVSLSGSLQEKLLAVAAAKFDAIELFENDLLFFDGAARDVRQMVEQVGLKIALFQPFRDFEAMPEEQFRRNLDRAERKFDLMGELGAKMMLVCSNVSPLAIDDDGLAAAQLHELAERAASRGIKIGYEALAWGAHVKTYGQVWRIVQKAAHSHLGVILDSFHTLALGDDPAGIADIPGEKIFFVQLADAPRLSMDVLSWSRHFRCFPGQGDLDVARFASHAIAAGYTGPLSLEIFNDEFRAASPTRTARDGMRSLLLLEEQIRLSRDAEPVTGDSARAKSHVDLLDPPPAPDLKGVAFLEFATSAAAASELSEWLTGLGFARVGRHRWKDVTLFKQGDLAIAVNAEGESFAHSYYLLHGVSVCAIGLRVDDPDGLLRRAEVLGCQLFEERVGPDELPMPGIRSPDGSLVYVVSEGFDPTVDFVRERSDETPPGRIVAVDHVGQALPGDQFESWLLYYRAVFGLQPEDSWALPDPYGLVKSRALANVSRTVRVPLSYSESSRTVVARSLSTFSGAGVNQVAFATDDIFKAVAGIRQRGLKLLAIPENYYDDLSARLGLSDEFLGKLRAHNVLYDRDAKGGEFLHAYSATFHDRFFFEIVQRTGGYDQYGAVNAPVRMAAQARASTAADPVI